MRITCAQCGADVLAENINIDNLIAKCNFCHAVFRFDDQLEPSQKPSPPHRLEVPMPKGIEVLPMGNRLEIIRKWFSLKIIFFTAFTVFWDGFMIAWFGIAFSQQQWLMAAFGTLHGAVGLGLLYYVLAGYLNRTVITVNRSLFTIKHTPLPWPGNKLLNPLDMTQLYCKERMHRNKNSISYTYEVHAISKDNEHTKLITGLDNSEQALYIEQEIERFLNIEDQPVRGELER
jgi:hypothetical protein